MSKYKIGIVGATGYTGSELLRLLIHHPDVTIEFVTSESHAGKRITDIHPHLLDISDIILESSDKIPDYDVDLVFLALPHGVSMNFVKEHGLEEYITIDLSGDFRLSSKDLYELWYERNTLQRSTWIKPFLVCLNFIVTKSGMHG